MALFVSRELKRLRDENEHLFDENVRLTQQKCTLEAKLFEMYGRETIDEITDNLDLSPLQRSKLAFLFYIERARLAGVPEDKILHDHDEINKFFMSGES